MTSPDFNEEAALFDEVRQCPVLPGCCAVAENGSRALSAKLQLASGQKEARHDLLKAKMCALLSRIYRRVVLPLTPWVPVELRHRSLVFSDQTR